MLLREQFAEFRHIARGQLADEVFADVGCRLAMERRDGFQKLEPLAKPLLAGRAIRSDVVRAFATVVALCTILVVAIAGVTLLATPI